ncbi:MAG: protein kinase [Deltaproteobacteria bacterium]|nr:protein kinase [Deltaproteobacteria bacterium]
MRGTIRRFLVLVTILAITAFGNLISGAGEARAEPAGLVLIAPPSVDPRLESVALGFSAWLELRLAGNGMQVVPHAVLSAHTPPGRADAIAPRKLVALARELGAQSVAFSSLRFSSEMVEVRVHVFDTKAERLVSAARAESPLDTVGTACELAVSRTLTGMGIDALQSPPPLLEELAAAGRARRSLDQQHLYQAWREVDGKISTTAVAVRKEIARAAIDSNADDSEKARVLAAAGETARAWALIERDVRRATGSPKSNQALLLAATEVELERSNLREARRYIERLIEGGVESAEIQTTYARVLLEQHDETRARKALLHAARLNPRDAWPYEQLARLESSDRERRALMLLEAGQREAHKLNAHRARSLLERAARTDPSVAAESWQSRGELDETLGHPAESLAAYRMAVEIGGENAELLGGIGNAQRALGDSKSAAAAYEKALVLQPNDAKSLMGLGLVHLDSNRANQAVPLLQRAAKLNPDDLEKRRNLVQALRATGDLEAAIDLLGNEPRSGSTENLRLAAEIHSELGQHEQARDLLLNATRLEPFSPEIQNQLAAAYSATGDEESAARAREMTALLQHGDPEQRTATSRALDRPESFEASGPDFDQLIRSFANKTRNAANRRVVRLEIRDAATWRGKAFAWLNPRAPDTKALSVSLDEAIGGSFALLQAPEPIHPLLGEDIDDLFEFEQPTSLDADVIARLTQTFDVDAIFLARIDWAPPSTEDETESGDCDGADRYDVEVRMLSGQHPDIVNILANTQCVAAGYTSHAVWNIRAMGVYAGAILLLIFPLVRGWGRIEVTVKVPPKTKGFFSIRVSKNANDVPTVKSKATDTGRLKKSLNSFSRYERSMVGRDTLFRWIPARKRSYHVTVKGPLTDAAGEEIIGHFLETQPTKVSRGKATKLEYDFRPKETALEVQVMNGETSVTGARIALRGQSSQIRYARNGSAIIPLEQGTHRVLIAAADRVAEYTLHIESLGRSVKLLAQLADENVLVFKDCAAATEPFLAGDYLTAADALDAAGQQREAHLVRATFHQQVGALDAAAQELEAAGQFEEAAELRAVGDDAAGSAALFEKAGDSGRAADAYRAAGEISDAARCYEAAYDYQSALECYREIGEDSKALEIIEKTGEFFEAGNLAREIGDQDRALGNLQQVERRDANYGDACKLIADLLEARGDFDVAADKVEEAIQTAGDKAPAALHERHAELLSKAGRPQRALEAYQTVRRIEPQRRDVGERIAELQQQITTRPDEGNAESRYEILGEVGRGAMGVVFKARDKNLGRIVALKRLPESLKNHPTAVALFKREAQAAAALNHRNIVTLFDAGEENGTYFITMELLEGFPLNQLLNKRGRLSVSDTARIGIQIAAGLQYACEQRIVHRDIKSGNLFFTTDRTVKIMDFGLAKTIEEVRKSSTMIGGTPNFMAPEQAAGGEVDHRADLYAFGVTLYQLVTGTVPFEDGDLAYHHRHTAPPDPRTRVDSIPPSLSQLILRMLAKSPDDRPADPAEVGHELQAILDGCPAASPK